MRSKYLKQHFGELAYLISKYDYYINGKLERSLEGHTRAVTQLKLLSDGKLVSCSLDGSVRIWNYESGKCEKIFNKYKAVISCLEILPNDNIVFGNYSGMIVIWDYKTDTYKNNTSMTLSIRVIEILPDRRFATGSNDSYIIKIWNPADLTSPQKEFHGHKGMITHIISIDSNKIVSGAKYGELRLWNLESNESQLFVGHKDVITSLYKWDDNRIISGSKDTDIRIWNIETLACLYLLQGHRMHIADILIFQDKLISTAADDTIGIWDTKTMKWERMLPGHTQRVFLTKETPDGKLLSRTANDIFRIWNPENDWKEELQFHVGNAHQILFHKNKIICACGDNTIKIIG